MSANPQPKLSIVDDSQSDAIPFERRAAVRHGASGHVTAVQCQLQPDGRRSRICSLTMLNISDLGAGVLSQEPLEIGSTITLFFPPHGPERGFDLYGKIVRCNARNSMFEVGIQLTARAAA